MHICNPQGHILDMVLMVMNLNTPEIMFLDCNLLILITNSTVNIVKTKIKTPKIKLSKIWKYIIYY